MCKVVRFQCLCSPVQCHIYFRYTQFGEKKGGGEDGGGEKERESKIRKKMLVTFA